MSAHTCHRPRCPVAVPPRMFMCRTHWNMLTKDHKNAIWAAYVPGQEIRKDPSPEYLQAARDAITYLVHNYPAVSP